MPPYSLRLNPTKQDIAYASKHVGNSLEDTLRHFIGAMANFYWNFHWNKLADRKIRNFADDIRKFSTHFASLSKAKSPDLPLFDEDEFVKFYNIKFDYFLLKKLKLQIVPNGDEITFCGGHDDSKDLLFFPYDDADAAETQAPVSRKRKARKQAQAIESDKKRRAVRESVSKQNRQSSKEAAVTKDKVSVERRDEDYDKLKKMCRNLEQKYESQVEYQEEIEERFAKTKARHSKKEAAMSEKIAGLESEMSSLKRINARQHKKLMERSGTGIKTERGSSSFHDVSPSSASSRELAEANDRNKFLEGELKQEKEQRLALSLEHDNLKYLVTSHQQEIKRLRLENQKLSCQLQGNEKQRNQYDQATPVKPEPAAEDEDGAKKPAAVSPASSSKDNNFFEDEDGVIVID